jgi:acylphosphatase
VTALLAKRFYISGLVQGVGFRFFARRAAGQLRVCGYARNLLDGRVEVYAIGSADQLQTFAHDLRRGPSGASVDAVAAEEAEVLAQFTAGFSIELED